MSQVAGFNNSYKPITNTAWVRTRLCKLQKRCTRLAAASDKVYQLLANGRWYSPGSPASSTTKTGRHDIAEILLRVALSTINQFKSLSWIGVGVIYVICVCLRILVSNTYCVVFFVYFICLRLECPMLSVSLDCSFLIAPSVSLPFVYLKTFLVFSVVTVTRSLVCFVILCKSLFVFLSFVVWSMCCLSFFDIRLLITPLVSLNFFIWDLSLPPPTSQ